MFDKAPHHARRIHQGEDNNERRSDIREDDVYCAQDVPVYDPTVHGSTGLRVALRESHGLHEHRQQ